MLGFRKFSGSVFEVLQMISTSTPWVGAYTHGSCCAPVSQPVSLGSAGVRFLNPMCFGAQTLCIPGGFIHQVRTSKNPAGMARCPFPSPVFGCIAACCCGHAGQKTG